MKLLRRKTYQDALSKSWSAVVCWKTLKKKIIAKQYIISFCLQSAQQKVKKSQRPKKKQDSGMKNINYFPFSIFDAPLLIRGSISHHTLNQDCNAM